MNPIFSDFSRKIPPRFVLEGYRQVVNVLIWKARDPKLDPIIIDKYVSLFLPPAAIDEVIWEVKPFLSAIKEKYKVLESSDSDQGLKDCIMDELSTIINLVEYVAHDKSGRKLVVWGIWRLANTYQKFTIKDLLMEVSYPDEIYLYALDEKPSGETSKQSNFLMMSPSERIFILRRGGISGDNINDFIKHLRNKELQELMDILRKLKIDVSDEGTIELTGENEAITKLLLQATGEVWPFFGIIVAYTDYFKLFRGQSSTLYVDVPSGDIYHLLERLRRISRSSNDVTIFYNAAKNLIRAANKQLTDEEGLSWLKFSLRLNKFMKKPYGLQVIIHWPEFTKFIHGFSTANKPIWKKYQYISSCRLPALEMISRDIAKGNFNLQKYYRVQNRVKNICQTDIEEIETKIIEIRKSLLLLQKKPWEFSRKTELLLSTPPYLLEAIALVNSIGEASKRGLFPSAYREIRVLLEKLSWTLFGDYLTLRCYQYHGLLDTCSYNYALLASKEWYEWVSKNEKELLLNIRAARKRVETLRKKLKHSYSLPGGDKFWTLMMSSWTFPSLVLLFGREASAENIPQGVPQYLPHTQLIPCAKRDFEILGEKLGLDKPADFAMDLINELPQDGFIIPPYPTTDFVIASVEKWFNIKGLNRKYGEYSAFVHSYPDTSVVFPFSSVLEVKIFAHEISTLKDIVSSLVESYLSMLRSVK